MAKPDRSDIDRMEEDMRGLDHNGLLQRQWKKLRQVLERNAGEKSPESGETDPADGKPEKS
jgi:hypothetical protein